MNRSTCLATSKVLFWVILIPFWQTQFGTIGENVSSIGNYAFYASASLTSITCNAVIPPSIGGASAFKAVNKSIPVYVSASSVSAYQTADYWKEFTNIQPIVNIIASGTCGVNGDNLIWKLTEEGELIIEGTGAMCDYSFGDAPWYTYNVLVKTITIEEKVTSIGSTAFQGCSNLTAITIPENMTSIGEWAFYNCSSLTAITIPGNVTNIGREAFCGCNFAGRITIPASVASIGIAAFSNSGNINEIVVAEENSNYDSRDKCNAIIETATGLLVAGCASTVIPEGVTSIGYGAFANCEGLSSIAIPEGVTSIAFLAFWECSNLTSVIIPKGMTKIEQNVFAECNSLASITCEAETPPYIYDSSTFRGVDKSIPVYVLESSVTAYQVADGWKEFTNIKAMSETITINQYGSGTYCSSKALDFSTVEGLKAYVAAGYNTGTGVVTLMRVNTTKAGVGLFVKGEPGTYEVPIISSSLDNTLNMLVGTLAKTSVNALSDDDLYANYKYTIIEDYMTPLFHRFADGSTLSAGKAYLQIPVAWLPAEAKSIGLRFDDGETTDVEEMRDMEQLSGVIYDLMGHRVTKPQRGSLYLIDGKKIIY